jgi:hypothetical protein
MSMISFRNLGFNIQHCLADDPLKNIRVSLSKKKGAEERRVGG